MSSVSLTIQGVTQQFATPIWLGSAELVPDHHLQDPTNHATGSVCHDAQQPPNDHPYFSICINTLDSVPADYDTEFTVLADPLSNSFAGFIFPNIDFFHGIVFQGKPDKLVVTRLGDSPGSVPEPATWALMMLGLGTVGMLLRSRRRVLAA
jgi:hypothetical protein